MYLTSAELSEILRVLKFLNDSDTKPHDISLEIDLLDSNGERSGTLYYSPSSQQYILKATPEDDNDV